MRDLSWCYSDLNVFYFSFSFPFAGFWVAWCCLNFCDTAVHSIFAFCFLLGMHAIHTFLSFLSIPVFFKHSCIIHFCLQFVFFYSNFAIIILSITIFLLQLFCLLNCLLAVTQAIHHCQLPCTKGCHSSLIVACTGSPIHQQWPWTLSPFIASS